MNTADFLRLSDRIKALYPYPIRADEAEGDEDAYCVAGAFLRWINPEYAYRFPGVELLTEELAIYTGMPEHPAKAWAELIIGENDSGNIKEAWRLLDMATAMTFPWP